MAISILGGQVLDYGLIFNSITFDEIDAAIPWINRDGAPRDECFMSLRDEPYTYGHGRGERTYHPVAYPALVEKIRANVSDRLCTWYEACFANRYADEKQHLGWHADDSDSIDHRAHIAIVSFGATREIWFRPKGAHWFGLETNVPVDAAIDAAIPKHVDRVALHHGSLLIMPAGMQQTHEHRIPKHSAKCGPRISLTFRALVGARL